MYIFKCKKCNKEIEVERKITDNSPPPNCECGGETVKQLQPTTFSFSKGGFSVSNP
jgi:putative FmdB family regulatory protein